MIKVSSAQLWVHDQDEALAFYRDKVGLEVRSDVTVPELGNFRWLTVGPAGQDDIDIALMAIPGPPVMDKDTADEVRNTDMRGLPEWCRRTRTEGQAPLRVAGAGLGGGVLATFTGRRKRVRTMPT